MELILQRGVYTKKSTTGRLYVNGALNCATLEDVCRDLNHDGDLNDEGEKKVFGQTAIPAGRYQVIFSFSNHFKKHMPLLLNVPGYGGVRIHSGNKPEDTEGCILVGKNPVTDWISDSRNTYEILTKQMKEAAVKESIYITIKDLPL